MNLKSAQKPSEKRFNTKLKLNKEFISEYNVRLSPQNKLFETIPTREHNCISCLSCWNSHKHKFVKYKCVCGNEKFSDCYLDEIGQLQHIISTLGHYYIVFAMSQCDKRELPAFHGFICMHKNCIIANKHEREVSINVNKFTIFGVKLLAFLCDILHHMNMHFNEYSFCSEAVNRTLQDGDFNSVINITTYKNEYRTEERFLSEFTKKGCDDLPRPLIYQKIAKKTKILCVAKFNKFLDDMEMISCKFCGKNYILAELEIILSHLCDCFAKYLKETHTHKKILEIP